jgi:hypothetical protein
VSGLPKWQFEKTKAAMNTSKNYDAYLTFVELAAEQAQTLQALFESQNLSVLLNPTRWNFSFTVEI